MQNFVPYSNDLCHPSCFLDQYEDGHRQGTLRKAAGVGKEVSKRAELDTFLTV
jgi:hypothetical protein